MTRHSTFCEEILEGLPHLFKELGVDKILLGGDLTTTALETEFRAAGQFVSKLPAPWIAIPGNHDVYTYRSQWGKTFYRFFEQEEGWGNWRLKEDRLEVHRLDETYWLVALDVCYATNVVSSRGLFSEELEEKMKRALEAIPKEGHIAVYCHYPFFHHDAPRRTLKRGEQLQKVLQRDPRIRLFLHGHTHRRTIANLLPSGLPLVLDSGSATQKERASWNLIDLTLDGCTVTPYQYKGTWQAGAKEEISWKI